MSRERFKAPEGKVRIIGIDLFSHEDYLVDDYDSREVAFKVADDFNKKRRGSMYDVYYVYDDQGKRLRGEEEVGQEIFP